MENRLKHLLKRYNLTVKYEDTHGKGYMLKTPAELPDVLLIKEGLSDKEAVKVILHEIGHAKNDGRYVGNYQTNSKVHCCSEHGANDYMIEEQVRHYIALGNNVPTTNYVDLAVSLGTKDYDKVKYELERRIDENKKSSHKAANLK